MTAARWIHGLGEQETSLAGSRPGLHCQAGLPLCGLRRPAATAGVALRPGLARVPGTARALRPVPSPRPLASPCTADAGFTPAGEPASKLETKSSRPHKTFAGHVLTAETADLQRTGLRRACGHTPRTGPPTASPPSQAATGQSPSSPRFLPCRQGLPVGETGAWAPRGLPAKTLSDVHVRTVQGFPGANSRLGGGCSRPGCSRATSARRTRSGHALPVLLRRDATRWVPGGPSSPPQAQPPVGGERGALGLL